MTMEFTTAVITLLIIILSSSISCSAAAAAAILPQGSSLSVEKQDDDVLLSPNAVFSAGFRAVGANAYVFAIWFTQPPGRQSNSRTTVVWTANRDNPVNGKKSTLSLLKTGDLILKDAGDFNVWSTDTSSPHSPAELVLTNNGNLVLQTEAGDTLLWQSFDFPTDTLLPSQILTRHTQLVSARSEGNQSSGYYKMFFDNDNVVRLLYDGPEYSSIYWPDPRKVSWDNGRTSYNSSRVAVLNSIGQFNASDSLGFRTADYKTVVQRRLTIEHDGNVRVYSRKDWEEDWYVSWQAISQPCLVHGICGDNSTCSYHPSTGSGRRCSCLPGHKLRSASDWSQGCEPEPEFHYNNYTESYYFLPMPHVDFYGYDVAFMANGTFQQCVDLCLQHYDCRSFQYKFIDGQFKCYPKFSLLNGFHSPDFPGGLYLKMPSSFSHLRNLTEAQAEALGTGGGGLITPACGPSTTVLLERAYTKSHVNGKIKLLLWFARVFGVVEVVCLLLVWCFLRRTGPDSDASYAQGYLPVGTGFRKYRYSELKKATRNFSEEIGRGADGIVYKGQLPVHDTVAIKKLKEANQVEAEFLDEVSTIGKLNHMNLIKMWGYCAEGKHMMLVYEYMEKGSLAENLASDALDFGTRFNIALGVARGLAYLHEECLEWILHCDVKPQNILLDSNYEPKVADFGLSKLLNRNGDSENSSFSKIRGTRGYMAPEWVFNLPITSKVDVYSYGIVVLEMVTGKSPTAMGVQDWRLVTWVREKAASKGTPTAKRMSWLKKIVDPVIGGSFDPDKLQVLVEVALRCVEEDRDARPTMKHVVETLQRYDND